MLSSLRSIKLDPLLTMLITAVILAIIVPARGDFAEWFSTGTKFAVALLFYLYGARLSTAEAIRGLTHLASAPDDSQLHVRAVPPGWFGSFTAAFCAR